MCPQVWQGHSCWKLAWLFRTFASFWGVYCSVNFGMVEFAALTVWLHWMICRSFRTSLDQMTESQSNSSGKYDRDCGSPERLWIFNCWQLAKKNMRVMRVDGTPSCQSLSKKGCYRLASLCFWWDARQAWWILETSWEYFTFNRTKWPRVKLKVDKKTASN